MFIPVKLTLREPAVTMAMAEDALAVAEMIAAIETVIEMADVAAIEIIKETMATMATAGDVEAAK